MLKHNLRVCSGNNPREGVASRKAWFDTSIALDLAARFCETSPLFFQRDLLASLAMTFLFHSCDKQARFGRWWLGMLLMSALGLSGCKTLGDHEDGLRRNDLAEPARQVRSKAESGKDKDQKEPDDPWMSKEAQKISRDLQ